MLAWFGRGVKKLHLAEQKFRYEVRFKSFTVIRLIAARCRHKVNLQLPNAGSDR